MPQLVETENARRPFAVKVAPLSKIEIDVVTAEFFDAFDNRGGKAADVARIRRLILPVA
ncbi:hypothetical protein AB0I10_34780 [Streptomyces sp. NPDC050636]|uniref:hypothetical protein n=1 Tax=Streptomyces sp. NPDC050636 TaxID=3154510 RepID=UPI003441777A